MNLSIKLMMFLMVSVPIQAATYNVRDFGAKGDGVTFDTASIQKALNACEGTDGTVLFPPGTYLSKPLVIRTKSTLLIKKGAMLKASSHQSDWMKNPGDWLKVRGNSEFIPFIGGSDLLDVTLTGEGIIDGGGEAWWGEAEKARQIKPGYTLPRPNLVAFQGCRNLRIENITLRNSPKFHLVPTECEGVVISNVTILAPEHAANTDAIDPGNCRNVLISHCRIDVGDDNVAIKAGHPVEGRNFACDEITVSDCAFLHGHGMSIGSETLGGVHNVKVKNCIFENTENGIRIKSNPGKGGLVEDITYDNITMRNVNPAITLTCSYALNSSGDKSLAKPTQESLKTTGGNIPKFRKIRISNLTATCQKSAGKIMGLPDSFISDVFLENVKISAPESFVIENAESIRLSNVSVDVANGRPFQLTNATVLGLP